MPSTAASSHAQIASEWWTCLQIKSTVVAESILSMILQGQLSLLRYQGSTCMEAF